MNELFMPLALPLLSDNNTIVGLQFFLSLSPLHVFPAVKVNLRRRIVIHAFCHLVQQRLEKKQKQLGLTCPSSCFICVQHGLFGEALNCCIPRFVCESHLPK